MQQYKAVCYGEILWDILPSGAKPGGAPMNVAYHLQKLGLQSTLISCVGQDKLGDDLLTILQQQSINTSFVQIDKEHTTGIVNAQFKSSTEASYDIVYSAAWDFISYQKDLFQLVQEATYFIFGSLAARNAVSQNTLLQLLEAANKKVLDINLRPPHFNKKTIENLLYRSDISKLNEHEIQLVSGWYKNYLIIDDQVNYIQDRFKIDTVLVTKGEGGALVNYKGKFFSHKGFKVNVADTIGSGDAFLAAYLFQLDNNEPPEEALLLANALGAFIATQSGACPLYSLKEVYKLMEKKN